MPALDPHLLEYRYLVPGALIAGSILFAFVFRVSLAVTALLACLPLGALYVKWPLASDFIKAQPLTPAIVGWSVLGALLFGFVLSRIKRKVVRRTLLFIMVLPLFGASILYLKPQWVDLYLPDWRNSAGLVLLVSAALGFFLSLLRLMRGFAVCALWAVVLLTFTTEIFLKKLPHQVVLPEWQRLTEELLNYKPQLPEASLSGRIGVLSFSGTALSETIVGAKHSFTNILERILESKIPTIDFNVLPSDTHMHSAALNSSQVEELNRIRPAVVILAPPLGAPDTSTTALKSLAALPQPLERSRVAQWISYAVHSTISSSIQPIGAFELQATNTIREAKKLGALPVILALPEHTHSEYQQALLRIAKVETAEAIDLESEFLKHPYDLTMLSNALPSRRGHGIIAERLGEELLRHRDLLLKEVRYLASSQQYLRGYLHGLPMGDNS